MSEHAGLRARKKERTRQVLSDTAIAMFLADGFDRVSVADIAAAAEVSKPTLFRHFAAKEDLILHRIADHQGEAGRVVRDRRSGETPLAALHRHFRAGLDAREPVTGLCDVPEVLAFHRLVFDTPTVATRVAEYGAADTSALAEALADAVPAPPLAPRLIAAQIIAVQQTLSRNNWAELAAGRTAAEVYPAAVEAADLAFSLLSGGAEVLGY
ncbi:TetR family transcriptional regulator [Nonomuraea sp. NPDC046570]|uniref:TetR/AcrR family transcriptional regulator n=1 Tax=Nonomuraea sp. NPDC046570 TaxID=3155255 RepID=UPI0033C80F88